ncbi:hypothetical protein PAPYR_1003 [Paratrimastix pyriformis]|uniref:Uncharacterized protein n=1 Tax=Paratrimastix pyriformis TaxID=342808 RepID=A0ABQ8UYA3_9EUKA|nr:hypothetical protein PAPYR_1003 [Paratrimastix pyriformis]
MFLNKENKELMKRLKLSRHDLFEKWVALLSVLLAPTRGIERVRTTYARAMTETCNVLVFLEVPLADAKRKTPEEFFGELVRFVDQFAMVIPKEKEGARKKSVSICVDMLCRYVSICCVDMCRYVVSICVDMLCRYVSICCVDMCRYVVSICVDMCRFV